MRHRVSMKAACAILALASMPRAQSLPYVVYEDKSRPVPGRHIVLIAGDEEYRSEEALPMLGKILAMRHGFKCTVLFSQDSATGFINPNNQTRLPGLSLLAQADLVVLATRFREWPDKDMKYFVDYLEAGKPILGLRTATHAFRYQANPQSPYAKYGFTGTAAYPGGFGRQVLGETWVDHHGAHGSQSSRGLIRDARKTHPILRGVKDIWGPSDVYKVTTLPADAEVLVDGQVLTGMRPADPPLAGKSLMPLAWTRSYAGAGGKPSRVFTSTMGAAQDFESEGFRRLIVNACYWGLGLEASIPDLADVGYVTPFTASAFGLEGFRKNVKPQDLALPASSGLGSAAGTSAREGGERVVSFPSGGGTIHWKAREGWSVLANGVTRPNRRH